MKLLLALCLVALAAAMTTPEPKPTKPASTCRCALGSGTHDHAHEIFEMKGDWDQGCDQAAEHLCQEECHVRRDQLEEAGAWRVLVDKMNHTVGDMACQSLGQDEEHGIHTTLLYSICGHDLKQDGPGLREALCCTDGAQAKCAH